MIKVGIVIYASAGTTIFKFCCLGTTDDITK